MFGAIARVAGKAISTLGRGSVSSVRSIAKVPLVKDLVKQTAIGGAIYAAGNAITGGGSKLPALPGLPGLPTAPGMGDRSIFRDDPNIIEALKPYAISAANLKTYYRAPKGFVIVHDVNGDPYALPKKVAQWARLWKPSPKPPISVGDWQAVKRADRTVKKVRKIMTTIARVDKATGKGGKVKVKGGRK